jgi:steroid 5-alpha reductase family enzyme
MIAGANALGLVISLATGSHLHLDLLGTGAFGAAAATGFNISPLLPRVKWSSIAVATWSVKLAGFLFWRVIKVKKDARLTDTLSTASGTAIFWTLSWLWGVICSLPYTLGTTSSSPGDPTSLKIGTGIYIIGLIMETLADYQKSVFKQSNPGQFCNVGLWSISQHPNFFGNLLVWSGIFIMNAPALVDPSATSLLGKYKRVLMALLSPLFMFGWFYGQASGTISNTVEMFEEKYGNNPGFQGYVDNVPLIFPNPFRKK